MYFKSLLLILFLFLGFDQSDTFKNEQLKYARVRNAYKLKEASLAEILKNGAIERNKFNIYLRAFKEEKEIELWAANEVNGIYKLLKTYEVCNTSGGLGPKRRQGDLQIPEGYYKIDRFNPYSNFYLSLGVNYPNASDKILGFKQRLGGDIFIHGACVTIGCLPITDEEIMELYIFCVEAKNNGQLRIPVTIFPCRLATDKYAELGRRYKDDTDKLNLWEDLKKGYDVFNKTSKLPAITFLKNGRHEVK